MMPVCSTRGSLSLAALLSAICAILPASAFAEGTGQPAWLSAQTDSKGPSFLQAADMRIKDQRPPPTAEQVAALKEMEKEVSRFNSIGAGYRDTIVSLLKRQYDRKRRDQDAAYTRQITAEEKLEDQARLDAIALFERFVAKYPTDPTYGPDAMFRLGELYFERDAIKQQDEMNAYLAERDRRLATGESTDNLVEPQKDYSATISVYQRLAQGFPNYDKLDGVFYLIGYCHGEMGQQDIARTAWLNLVCGNHFKYTGEAPPKDDQAVVDARAAQHPALQLKTGKKPAPAPAAAPFEDPYAGCEPLVKDSKFWAETWLRVGEYHFDLDFSKDGLSRAISAYSKVLERPDDRNYNLALYKVAWTYYRASNYPQAIAAFAKLVQWSDDERKRTGKGSELRDEAVQYLAIAFEYDDWNENQVSDPLEGQPRGIDRVQDAKLMPQDRPWTSEVYFRLGSIYFDEAKYPEAIEVWKLSLKRWPMDSQAPDVQNNIATAYARHNEQPESIAARAKLSDYVQGSDWWEANKDHPVEQRHAEQLAEDALINTAVAHHQQAQTLRRRCVDAQEPDLCTQAQEEYGLAALAYRGYIQHYPNSPQAYELSYNLADALYWSENYEEAAKEYALVRDSNLDDKYLSIAARLAVESIKRLFEKKQAAGEIQMRTDPPAAAGTPPKVTPIDPPELLQRLAQARELYLARVDDAHDTEKVRDSYFYNNTLLLYLYGYWDLARERFWAEFVGHCSGPKAQDSGQVAWLNLRNMAVALNETEEVRGLGSELQNRKCTFTPSGTAVAAVDCTKPENKDAPKCIAGQDLTNMRYKDAVDIFARAEKATGDQQRALYEQAASELVKAVNEEPNHPQAPLALEKAAIALERTSRFESAGRLYQRIIDEVGPRKAATPEDQKSLDAILANAYFRLAYNANRFFDFDRAVDNYRMLADSPRFSKSTDPQMAEWREGSLINAAKILEYQQQYARAADYYGRAADILRDPNEQRVARYKVADMAVKLKQWAKAVTALRAFIAKYQTDKQAGEQLVQAYASIADVRKQQGSMAEYKAARKDVITAFARSGQAAGSFAAEYAASAQFEEIDETGHDFESFAIKPGKPATLDGYVKGVAAQIEAGSREAKTKGEAFNVVPPYRRPTWTIAAFVRQGRIYEILAKAVLNTPFVVPADLEKKMKGLPPDSKDQIKGQIEDTIRQLLDTRVRPIECLAVGRYALAARAARAGSLDNTYTREAFDRINAYGDERIAECVAQVAAQDKTFQAYQTGEFTRAPRGLDLDMQAGVAPPPLAGQP
ncbi:MAG: tetratricopeptide repeat protein [Polyangiales bacterium]